jgi:hypothetical protein
MKDRVTRWFMKTVLVLAAIEIGLTWLAETLQHLSNLELMTILGVASCIAYLVRERRRPPREPKRISRGERTPIFPPGGRS